MPSLIAASATRLPTLPSPTTPRVWRGNSKPENCFLPSSTSLLSALSSPCSDAVKLSAGTRLRAASSTPAITSSFTALAFAPGALKTGTPRLFIRSTGMLFTPAPARPIALTLAGMSIACMSWERTRMASGSCRCAPWAYCPAGSRFNPTWEIELSVRTLKWWLVSGRTSPAFSAVSFFEGTHELHESFYACHRHGVVDRRAHAAHRAVALQLGKPGGLRLLEERRVQLVVLQRERDVHSRPVLGNDRRVIELGLVEVIVDD